MPTTEQTVAVASGRRLAHPSAAEIRLETVLHALADPVRLTIVRELADGHGTWPASRSTFR
ncbi:Transcriptional regulator OS=Streptomyces microflavus OX=1919 GN=Smic_81470 PE=4 SV=1 [Streptomyces microflavus]